MWDVFTILDIPICQEDSKASRACQRRRMKCEVLPKSWTKVMRQSHFEFCIGQDLTHSIFL